MLGKKQVFLIYSLDRKFLHGFFIHFQILKIFSIRVFPSSDSAEGKAETATILKIFHRHLSTM